MRVLVTGASGFVGSYVTTFCPAHHQVHPLSRKSIPNGTLADLITLTVEDFVALFSHQAIEGIIHLAAEANISHCEHAQEAHALNVGVTQQLVSAARQTGLPILFASTDQVFSGDEGHLFESTPPNPCHQYGQQKLEAEQVVLDYAKGLVLRLPLVLGRHSNGRGSLEAMLNQGGKEGVLHLFVDEFRRPIHAMDAAKAFWAAFQWEPGVYHISGPELMSRVEIAQAILPALQEKSITILPTSLKDQSFGYTRPHCLDLVTSKQEVKDLRVELFQNHIYEVA